MLTKTRFAFHKRANNITRNMNSDYSAEKSRRQLQVNAITLWQGSSNTGASEDNGRFAGADVQQRTRLLQLGKVVICMLLICSIFDM